MDPNGRRLQLYDLSIDVGEENNIAEANPKHVQRLKTLLLDWYRSLPKPGSLTSPQRQSLKGFDTSRHLSAIRADVLTE
jgi:hypothetical protein